MPFASPLVKISAACASGDATLDRLDEIGAGANSCHVDENIGAAVALFQPIEEPPGMAGSIVPARADDSGPARDQMHSNSPLERQPPQLVGRRWASWGLNRITELPIDDWFL